MKWITRQRPKVDRIACPWLILRFIDPGGEIVYVPAEEVLAVAEREGGYSFDAKGATYSHRRQPDGTEWCTFETLVDAYRLGDDPALAELARIVHAADIARDIETHPFGAAVRAIGDAGAAVEADDQQLLHRGRFVYDALYAHCQHVAGQAGS
jgi:hypothetical protein